jgi:invasion protein IalB
MRGATLALAARFKNNWIYTPRQTIICTMPQTRTMYVSPRTRAAGMRHLAAAMVVAASPITALSATTVLAQTSEVAAWRVECTGDGKTLDCRAVQQIYQRETRQLLVSVLARRAPDAKSALLTIQLPLGLNLTEPVQIKVDNGQPERQPIQTCTNIGCFVSMTANERLVAAMRTGSELKIIVQDASKKPVEMGLPLLGFGVAFDKARS